MDSNIYFMTFLNNIEAAEFSIVDFRLTLNTMWVILKIVIVIISIAVYGSKLFKKVIPII